MPKPRKKTNNIGQNKDMLYTSGEHVIAEHRLPDVCHTSHGLPQRTVATNVNLRSGFNRYDKDRDRIGDKLPSQHADIILACQSIYRKIGVN